MTSFTDWDVVPEDLRETCQSCQGSGTREFENESSFLNTEQCPECDGRGWTLCPIQTLIEEINNRRSMDDVILKMRPVYHGWITKEDEIHRVGEISKTSSTYRARDSNGGILLMSYDIVEVIMLFEKRLGNKTFDIEENLSALGAFKVFTMEDTVNPAT